jgi:hypothetical protein
VTAGPRVWPQAGPALVAKVGPRVWLVLAVLVLAVLVLAVLVLVVLVLAVLVLVARVGSRA